MIGKNSHVSERDCVYDWVISHSRTLIHQHEHRLSPMYRREILCVSLFVNGWETLPCIREGSYAFCIEETPRKTHSYTQIYTHTHTPFTQTHLHCGWECVVLRQTPRKTHAYTQIHTHTHTPLVEVYVYVCVFVCKCVFFWESLSIQHTLTHSEDAFVFMRVFFL